MITTSEVVVLVTSQQWIWDECATHQRAAMCGHELKWHDKRDSCRLARMADGAARVGGVGRLWTALCGWIGSSGAASTTSNREEVIRGGGDGKGGGGDGEDGEYEGGSSEGGVR